MTYYTSLRSASVDPVLSAGEPRGRSPGCHWAEYRLKTALLLVALGLVLLVWRMTPQGSQRADAQGISRNNRDGTGGRGDANQTVSSAPEDDTSPPNLDYFGRADLANEQREHDQLMRPRRPDNDTSSSSSTEY